MIKCVQFSGSSFNFSIFNHVNPSYINHIESQGADLQLSLVSIWRLTLQGLFSCHIQSLHSQLKCTKCKTSPLAQCSQGGNILLASAKPWMGQSPAEKVGGLDVGLATHPIKKPSSTETARRNQKNLPTCAKDDHSSMTVVDQSPSDIHYPMRGLIFNAKAPTRLWAWNVRILFQCGKLAQLLNEFIRYRLDIPWISKMWWTNSGRMTSEGKTII